MPSVLLIDEDPHRIADLARAGETATLRAELAQAASWYPLFAPYSALVRSIAAARAAIMEDPPWTGLIDDDPELLLMGCCPHPSVDGWGYCEACGADQASFENDTDPETREATDDDEDLDGGP